MKVDSIEQFLNIIRDLQIHHSDESLYFRGESSADWELRPSIMRDGLFRYENEMLTDLITRRPDDFDNAESAISQWVLAQHHGLKTRFLDITKNPLVALFHSSENKSHSHEDGRLHIFAVPRDMVEPFNSDGVSVVSSFAKLTQSDQEMLLTRIASQTEREFSDAMNRLIQLVRVEKDYIEEPTIFGNLFRVLVIEPLQSSERIRAQSGAFLASAFHHRFEREEIVRSTSRFPVYAHYTPTVPNTSKGGILRELSLLNISSETLFPGLDESARAITATYYQRLEQG